jgi:hypothetical protein
MGTKDLEALKLEIQGYRKIYHIRLDLDGAGWGAVILHIISLLRYCDRENYYPVVDLDGDCINAYFDSAHGNNTWHQYFEPVMPLSSGELLKYLPELDQENLIHRLSSEEAKKICVEHDDSVYSYTFGRWRNIKIPDLELWYDHERAKARATIKQYIRPNQPLQQRIDTFIEQHFSAEFTLGLHVRGTDLNYAPVVAPAEYFSHVDQWLKEKPTLKIFLATDQIQYLDVFRERYGDIVIYTNCFRSDNDVAPFNRDEITPFEKGEEVMLDILLLSRCDFLIKSSSNVSEMAMYFGENLQCLDLAYNKDKAYGEDYTKHWSERGNKAAWDLVRNTELTQVSNEAASQSSSQARHFLFRKYYYRLRAFAGKVLRRLKIIP